MLSLRSCIVSIYILVGDVIWSADVGSHARTISPLLRGLHSVSKVSPPHPPRTVGGHSSTQLLVNIELSY